MQNALAINKSIYTPQMLFGSDNTNDFGNRVRICRMEGDSMRPTIEPGEVVAFSDCGGRVLNSGIYVYTMEVFGRECLFIKRIEPLPEGDLKIISDNLHYQSFRLAVSEQNEMRIYGMVIASLVVKNFA